MNDWMNEWNAETKTEMNFLSLIVYVLLLSTIENKEESLQWEWRRSPDPMPGAVDKHWPTLTTFAEHDLYRIKN